MIKNEKPIKINIVSSDDDIPFYYGKQKQKQKYIKLCKFITRKEAEKMFPNSRKEDKNETNS